MTKRDDMHRCGICKKLFKDEDCILELNEEGGSNKGFQCPNLCVEPFEQPPYELPTIDE